MVAINPTYRNTRELYYTDKHPDSQGIGTIITTLKSTEGSYDHSFIPTSSAGPGGTTKYVEIAGDAQPENNPEYQYPGFIYCDGSEYYIHDYPALYEAIGNDYGGIQSDGIDVLTTSSNWSGTVTATIDAPPTGANAIFEGITPTQATCSVSMASGQITGVEVLSPGLGYDPENPPNITFSATGTTGTVTYAVRINPNAGSIASINRNNVWLYWPDENMGTFKVPDLKAKRIVGNGPVYGPNTPNVGNSELGVGIDTIDGNWYMDKNAQKGQFSLGNITTSNYSNVIDTVEASIIGGQVIEVTMQEKKISGAPQHSHFLLHCEAPQDTGMPQAVSGDRYIVSYKPGTGKVNSFLPPGGIAYNHTHVLSKAPILDNSVGTYDIYNWSGGDQDSGSIKEPGFYYASGGAGAGSYVQQTGYATPVFYTFTSTSSIAGRTIIGGGVPIYETTVVEYTNAGTYTPSVPSGIDQATVSLVGGGGSGAVYSKQGNNGSTSRFDVGSSGSILRLNCGGGTRGGAASTNSGGEGGAQGSTSKSGSKNGDVQIIQNNPGTGGNGGDGGNGPCWKKLLENPSAIPENSEGTAGANLFSINGTKGRTRIVNDTGNVTTNFSYSSGTQNWTAGVSNSNYGINGITWELWGGGGRDCGNFGGNGCGANGEGGSGSYMKIAIANPTSGTTYQVQTGQSGRSYNGQAAAAHSGKGGRAGEGYGSNNGGGGGAATILKLQSGNITIAGAGGGGGGGGFGEGSCGQNGQSANSPGNNVIETSQALFTGTGATGGRYGCTGGGGGGGGGGCGRNGDTQGGQPGAGGGGSGGHEQGYGGKRGLSAVRTQYISDVISQSNSNPAGTNGKAKVTVAEERGYWTSGGGGGGSGGFYQVQIPADVFTGQSNVSITVGEGGSGVSQSGTSSAAGSDGYAKIEWQVQTGTEGGTETPTTASPFEGGSGNADNGVNFFQSGSGSGSSSGFKLATTQTPTVVFEGGGGGSGAAASVTVSGNKITGISLTNSGSGYTEAPRVRILNGAGVRNHAVVGFDPDSGELENLTLVTSEVPTHYLKFGGTQNDRNVVLPTTDASEMKRVFVKVARGNGSNGGDTPENGGDELLLYYNTTEDLNFPSSGFIGTLVPIPTASELSSNYDGDGTGNNATNWYTYSIDLAPSQQQENVRFSIRQNRGAASGANDNAANTDNYGIVEIGYEYEQTTELVFVPSEGKMAIVNDSQSYNVQGAAGSTYTSGIFANDLTITLSSANPIIPVASLDPDQVIPLIEPYMLVKYLIKAF